MKGYFENLPPNLERAARIDGCTRLQTIWKIVLPVARPGIGGRDLLLPGQLNEFIFALILTGSPKAQTIPVIIAGFLVQLRFFDYGPMFAASVLAVIPLWSSRSRSSATSSAGCSRAAQGLGEGPWPASPAAAHQAVWRLHRCGRPRPADRGRRVRDLPRPSGCGKSTALACIAGLEDLSDGSIVFDGRDVTELSLTSATSPWSSRTMRSTRT